jgi:hypothetical protein
MTENTKPGLLKAAMLAATASLLLAPAADAARISNPVASFSGLDKITGRITSFDVYVGETVQFGALQVTPKACFNRDDQEVQRVDAFVEVDEITLDRKIKRIFTGWMFAESPALNAIEHPIFDVWLKECKQKTNIPAPKDLKIPPSGPDPLAQPAAKVEEPAPIAEPSADAQSQPIPEPGIPQPTDVPVEQAPLAPPVDPAVEPDQPPAVEQAPQEGVPDQLDPNLDPDYQGLENPDDLPPLPPPDDVGPLDPDPGFGLPPEPVPDDGLGNGEQGVPFPPPPQGGQQGLSGGGLF